MGIQPDLELATVMQCIGEAVKQFLNRFSCHN